MNKAYFEASGHAVNLDWTSQEKNYCKKKEENQTSTRSHYELIVHIVCMLGVNIVEA